MSPQLLSLLSQLLLEGEGAIPIRVSLRTDDEVTSLRKQVSDLTADVQRLKTAFDHTEYLFRCESVLNGRLIDLCRENGIELGPAFFERPY